MTSLIRNPLRSAALFATALIIAVALASLLWRRPAPARSESDERRAKVMVADNLEDRFATSRYGPYAFGVSAAGVDCSALVIQTRYPLSIEVVERLQYGKDVYWDGILGFARVHHVPRVYYLDGAGQQWTAFTDPPNVKPFDRNEFRAEEMVGRMVICGDVERGGARP